MSSETAKHRKLVEGYCVDTPVLDLGSAGDPIVPHAIQVELPNPYCPYFDRKYPPQILGDAKFLKWFTDGSVATVFSSHLIEDFGADDQVAILREWARVIRIGGHMVILAPEKKRWAEALRKGQPPNLAHKHEPEIGEFSKVFQRFGNWEVLEDRYCDGEDYGMFFVAKKMK